MTTILKRHKNQLMGPYSFTGTPVRKIRYVDQKPNQPLHEATLEALNALRQYFTIGRIVDQLEMQMLGLVDPSEANLDAFRPILDLLQQELNLLQKSYPIVELAELQQIDYHSEERQTPKPTAVYQHHTDLNLH